MESFFDQYRKKAEAIQDFPLHETDWLKLEKKLNDRDKPRPVPLYFWPILAGVVLFSLYVLFKKSKQATMPANNTFNSAPVSTEPLTSIFYDTIYIEKPVYIIRNIEKKVFAIDPEIIKKMDGLTWKNYELVNTLKQQQNKLDVLNEMIQERSPAGVIEVPEIKSTSIPVPSSSNPSLPEQTLAPEAPEIPLAVSLPLAADTLTPWKKFLSSFTPTRLDISAVSGIPFILHPQIRNKTGYQFGIKLLLALQSNVEIQSGLMYTKLFYEGPRMDENIGIPIQQPPLNDLRFTKAEVSRPAFNLDLGVHYKLFHNKRMVPKIGLGIGFILPTTSQVTYDFHSPSSPLQWSLDSFFKPRIKNPYSLQWHGALTYKLSTRWTWVLQSTLHQKLRRSDFLSKRIDVSTALAYRLY